MKSSIFTYVTIILIIVGVHCEHVIDLGDNANNGMIAFARFQGLEEQSSRLRHPSIINPAQVHSEEAKAKEFLSTLKRHKRKSRQYGSTDIYGQGYLVRPRPAEPVPLSM